MRRFPLLAMVVWSAAASTTVAGQEDVAKKPYAYAIAVSFEPHPLITAPLLETLGRELRDTFRRELGKAGVVDLADQHPLLDEVRQHGWKVLDRPHPINDQKVHLARLAFSDGQYEVQARQVDGYTGLVTPLRKIRTPDRQLLPRLTALALAGDFGVVGEVVEVRETEVRLRMRASALEEPVLLKVDGGHVFAISRLVRGADGKVSGERVPDALLYTTSASRSEAATRMFHRFQDPLEKDRSTVGFRAVRLGTRSASLSVRVVDDQTGEPLAGCAIWLSSSGLFDAALSPEKGVTDAKGWYRSPARYSHVVFMRPFVAGRQRADVPIPLLDDQPVELRVTRSDDAETLVKFEHAYMRWLTRLGESSLHLDVQVRAINELEKANQREQALQKARELSSRLELDLKELKSRWGELQAQGLAAGMEAASMLAEGDRLLAALAGHAKGLQAFVATAGKPASPQGLADRARLMEQAGDPECLVLYEEALKGDPKLPGVRERFEVLKKGWERKEPAAEEARSFIHTTWPGLTVEEAARRTADARKALSAAEAAGDLLSLRKLARANLVHLDRMNGALNQLAVLPSEDASRTLLQRAIAELRDMNRKADELANK